jgi:hypothetical protein
MPCARETPVQFKTPLEHITLSPQIKVVFHLHRAGGNGRLISSHDRRRKKSQCTFWDLILHFRRTLWKSFALSLYGKLTSVEAFDASFKA